MKANSRLTWLGRSAHWSGLSLGILIIWPASSWANQPSLAMQADSISRDCIDAVYQQQPTAIDLCQQAVDSAQAAKESRLEAYNLGNLGTLYLQQESYSEAKKHYDRVLEIAEALNDTPLQLKALVALGAVQARLDQPQAALDLYSQALNLAQTVGDGTATATALYNQGLMYSALKQTQAAMAAYQRAIVAAQAVNDPILEAYAATKLNLARAEGAAVGRRN